MAEREATLAEKEEALAAREAELEERLAALDSDTSPVEEPTTEKNADTPATEAGDHPIRLGTHNITLQWISWDYPGSSQVTLAEDGRYQIFGEQFSRENDDFLRIFGFLTPQDERTLLFDGKIEYRVSHNNDGEVCVKEGPLHFKASGKRQYWRLQEMTNCEGGMLTDYIDIYF